MPTHTFDGSRSQRALVTVAFGGVLIVAAILRLHGLELESVWLDEAFSIMLARGDMSFILLMTSQDYHPPLHYVLLHGWVHLLDGSTWSARLLSALLSVGTIGAAGAVAARLCGVRVALVTAMLLAVSVFQVEYAQEARMYTLLSCLATLSTYGFIRLFDRGSVGWFLFFTAMCALMAYTHVYGFFVIAAQGLTVLADLAWRRGQSYEVLGRWVAAMSLAFASFLGWLPTFTWQLEAVQSGFWIAPPEWTGRLGPLLTYAGSPRLAAVLAGLAAWGLFALSRRPARTRPVRPPLFFLLPWLIGPVLFPYLISLVSSPIFLPKYTIAASVPLAILAAAGIVGLPWVVLRMTALATCLVFSWTNLEHYYATPAKDGWREAVSTVERLAQAGDLVVVYPYFNRIPFSYYQRRDDVVSREFPLFTAPPPPDGWSGVMERAVDEASPVWLVFLDADSTAAPVLEQFRSRLHETSVQVIQRIAIHRFERSR